MPDRNRFTSLLKPLTDSARALGTGPVSWRTWVGLIIIPAFIVGMLAWAFWSPTENHGTAQAAIVNNDQPVKVNGQLLPIGRELAGKLVDNDDSSFDWTVTNTGDANSGLSSGKYAAVVTIPKNFSKAATSTSRATKGRSAPVRHARVRVRTSKHGKVLDPITSTEVAKATVATLNHQIVRTYLDNLYVGFNSMHDMVAKAAGGANKLADGTGQLAGQSGKLVNGTKQLAGGVDKLDDGADALAGGVDKLAGGADALAGGLDSAAAQTKQLPEQSKKLANGARQVANGNRQLANQVGGMADQIIALTKAAPSGDQAADQLTQLAQQCQAGGGSDQFCARLSQVAGSLNGPGNPVDQREQKIQNAARQAKQATAKLADGADKVADGNEKLAAGMPKLAHGIGSAASGADKLAAGVHRLDGGAHQLAGGTGQLAGRMPQLVSGTGQFQQGVTKLDNGATKFANGLTQGKSKVPSYSKNARDQLSQVAANPTKTSTGIPEFGPFAIGLILAVALWALALATYIVTRALPADVLTSRSPTWKLVARAVLPGACVATVSAVLINLVLLPFLDLGVGDWFALLGVTVLAANCFVALNHAVVAIFHRPGRYLSLAVLVLAVASGLASTVPGFFNSVGGLLPTAGCIQAVRAVTTGADGLGTGVTELVAWLVVAGLVTIVVTDRRRSLPARQLRLGTQM